VRLSELAAVSGLEVVRDAEVSTLGFLSDPEPGMLTFLDGPRFLGAARRAMPAAVLAPAALAAALEGVPGLVLSERPRRDFVRLHNHLAAATSFYGENGPTVLDPTARVHETAWIAPDGVAIGPGTVVEPRVVVFPGTVIGARCTVRAGAVLGSVGFQILRDGEDVVDVVHAGGVLLEDDVHVMAGAVIAAAVFRQRTTIGTGSRIGNLAFVSHNVRAGKRSVVGHGAVVNGNVVLGDDVWIGPGATISNNVAIGSGARVSLGSAVIGDVSAGAHVTGNVAVDHRQYLRHLAR
jgi:UDP-3-O-[3-hydroxymyristoyl] glucosamine N-acyltransferase